MLFFHALNLCFIITTCRKPHDRGHIFPIYSEINTIVNVMVVWVRIRVRLEFVFEFGLVRAPSFQHMTRSHRLGFLGNHLQCHNKIFICPIHLMRVTESLAVQGSGGR